MPGERIRTERDEFIAFALAAADLLVSVDEHDTMTRVIGAAKTLLKGSSDALRGRDFLSAFDAAEASFVRYLLKNARKHGRIEPAVVMLGASKHETIPANIGMTYLPEKGQIYVSMTILPHLVMQNLPRRDPETGLLDRDAFEEIAKSLASVHDDASEAEALKELRLIRLRGLPSVLERLPTLKARTLMAEIGAFLRGQACDGGVTGQLDGERFGVIARTQKGIDHHRHVATQVSSLLDAAGIDNKSVDTISGMIALDLKNATAVDAAKALAFAIGQFTKVGPGALTPLSSCLQTVVGSTVGRLTKVRDVIASKDFEIHYQPIVDLLTGEAHHYEALMRLNDGSSPFDTVTFSENLGVICELDMAIVEQVLSNMRNHPDLLIAVNLSGSSLENEAFRSKLISLMSKENAYANNLMFELTESAVVHDVEPVANFLSNLRKRGNLVCLDDFGAGATAYNYLRQFDADFVKIDGPFLKDALRDDRQRALVHSIATLCSDLNTRMIAEMIETEQMAQAAASLGIGFGQGYFYGKPAARLHTITHNGRRAGTSETWQ